MAVLTTKARNNLPASDFVFPKSRRYPIADANHARNALARASGKPEEAMVRAKVHKKFPDIGVANSNMKRNAAHAMIQERARAY